MARPTEAKPGLIRLKPVAAPKLWGGTRLHEYLDEDCGSERIGELFLASAADDGVDTPVDSEYLPHRTLLELWRERPDLFGRSQGSNFPLQIKLIDAEEDLSVQVHPDEAFARARPGAHAKTECWYAVHPSRHGTVLLGHDFDDAESFRAALSRHAATKLLTAHSMSAGDFYYVPAGTPHCILAGSLVFEVLQSSETTYRLCDHGRVDTDGRGRTLHVDDAIEAMRFPSPSDLRPPAVRSRSSGGTVDRLIDTEYFGLQRAQVLSRLRLPTGSSFAFLSVVSGVGYADDTPVRRGDTLLVPAHVDEVALSDGLDVILTTPGPSE